MFHFDDKDLRLVLAIDRCGNISEAARSVHLAVSSASARLTELESRLDVRLFERRSHGVRTAPAGEVFVRHARKMILEPKRSYPTQNAFDALKRRCASHPTSMHWRAFCRAISDVL